MEAKKKVNSKNGIIHKLPNLDSILESKDRRLNFEKLSKIILKSKKSLDDIQNIVIYLSTLEEFNKFLKIDNSNIHEILTQIAFLMKYEHQMYNKILFKIGKYRSIKQGIKVKNFILF